MYPGVSPRSLAKARQGPAEEHEPALRCVRVARPRTRSEARMPLSETQLADLHRLLAAASDMDPSSPAYLGLERAVSHLAKTARSKRRLERKQAGRAQDAALLRGETEGVTAFHSERACYVCKVTYRVVSTSHPQLCLLCAARSAAATARPLDLHGRRALVTGGRVKIGFATALALLRAGAEVHVTSRFPRAAEAAYAGEDDVDQWRSRLHVHGADFRDLRRLVSLVTELAAGPPFDMLINNAAQSTWQPAEVFERLHAGEQDAAEDASAAPHETALSLLPPAKNALRALDLTREDSWVQKLGEISPLAMVEAQVVNAIAPYLLCSGLRENLRRAKAPDRYIVNVTAAEGQFLRAEKTTRHPHNNMAKASLNMLTRTSADDLVDDGIYLTSVDPGWVSREGRWMHEESRPPEPLPLTLSDAAARVLHPIAEGVAGRPVYGVLLKDFVAVPW